jgi:leucyl/phenylalanyl-tRNA--protein transferase
MAARSIDSPSRIAPDRTDLIPWLEPGEPFPPVDDALEEPAGLLAAGIELTPERLIEAYREGIFPWFSDGQPVLWWSTNPRMVLYTEEFRSSHTLSKRMARMRRSGTLEVRCDFGFEAVMRACAVPRDNQNGTWITQPMIDAYVELHRMGLAHSVETWIEGRLAGGLYGIAIGRMFYGESMFARATDASKIAIAHLVQFLIEHEFPMIDCQQETAHLASLGARPIPREHFVNRVAELVEQPGIGAWPGTLQMPSAPLPRKTESA